MKLEDLNGETLTYIDRDELAADILCTSIAGIVASPCSMDARYLEAFQVNLHGLPKLAVMMADRLIDELGKGRR